MSVTAVISKVFRGSPTTVVWELQDWNDPSLRTALCSSEVCDVSLKVNPSGNETMKTSVPDPKQQWRNPVANDRTFMKHNASVVGAEAHLRFRLEEHTTHNIKRDKQYQTGKYYEDKVETTWVGLHATELGKTENSVRLAGYQLRVNVTESETRRTQASFQKTVGSDVHMKTGTFVVKKLVKVEERIVDIIPPDGCHHSRQNEIGQLTYPFPGQQQPQTIVLRLEMTPLYTFLPTDNLKAGGQSATQVKTAEASICQDLKRMMTAEETYTDLTLELKDNLVLSSHKFLLAARSHVFQTMIEQASKNNDFNGILKIPDVNGKPMMVVLHWMYSGELHENAGNVMEEVVEAAIRFQLPELIKLLDKEVIKICTPENMFQLFKVARANGMPKAKEDIGKFIKNNLGE